ncbi:MAG: energy-coupling factor transporter transmembrane component T, partial [Oscillospiraceae bacterium]
MAVLAAVINPAFTHQGVTILAYLPSGNPLTLESMLYGLASAALLSATLLWFTCYNAVMTSDKFIYLFGRVIPALSLVLSMTMRFVPRFRTQLHTVAQAQKYMGRDTENGSLLRRTKNAMKVFSIMVTWSLESAIETADSMKSRGYGEKGRTAFSIYRMDDRDRSLLVWFIFCGAYVLCGVLAGGLRFRYYPSLAGAPVTPMTVSFFVVYFLLCLTPAALDLTAARQWRQIEKEVRR